MAESTPFLAHSDDGDDYDNESHPIKTQPANAHFKRPISLLTILNSFLSIGVFGLLIATVILASTGPFNNVYSVKEALRDLTIVLGVNFILTTPAIFFQLPIILNIAVHIAMSVVCFVFSAQLFGRGWPDSYVCREYHQTPNGRWEPKPPTWECKQARQKIQIMAAVGAGLGIFIGLLILTTLLLRLVAVVRSQFWHGKAFASIKGYKGLGWNPTGFTVQFTLSVLPAKEGTNAACTGNTVHGSAGESASGAEGERLIET